MNFTLTKEQSMIQQTAREFAAKEIAPIAREIDMTGEYPTQVMRSLNKLDLLGLMTSPEYGGSGLSPFEFAIVNEEISAVSAALGVSLAISSRFAYDISRFGTKNQKKAYLPGHAKGEILGAIAFTEPGGGSNWPLTVQTSAQKDGDDYIINGSKCFISNAGVADVYIVMARLNGIEGPQGISAFIIEKETPNFSVGSIENKFGLRGYPTGELFFDNCRIPKANLLGTEGEGFTNFQTAVPFTFAATASVYVGLARAAMEESVQFAKQREVAPSKTLAQLESSLEKVSEMAAEIECSRLLMQKAAWQVGKPGPIPVHALLKCCRTALKITGDAVALHGGYGCLQESTVNRLFRDAKTLSLQISYDKVKGVAGAGILGG